MSAAIKTASRKDRSNEIRDHAPARAGATTTHQTPAAGAHAARHLVNEEATPGAGALPSHSHRAGKDVDGGAG